MGGSMTVPAARQRPVLARPADAPRRELAVLLVVALAMLLTLPLPFGSDQALFATGARELAGGAALYRDFWDIKQPGIYLFHLAARVLGSGPVALRLLELAWTLGLAVLLQRGSRGWFRRPRLSTLLPLAVVLPYALSARAYTLQVEWLVQLPLVAVLVLARRGARSQGRWSWVAAGAAGGVVCLFKLLLAPLVLLLLVAPLITAHRSGRGGAPVRALLLAGAGLVGVLAALMVAPAAAAGSLGLLWRTVVLYPPLVAATPEQHTLELVGLLARRAVRVYSCTGVLALLGLLVWVRSRPARRAAATGGTDPAPRLAMLGWVLLAALLVAQQRWSDYQVYLVIVPVGILAVAGVDAILVRAAEFGDGLPARLRLGLVAGAAVLALPGVASAALPVRAHLQHGLALRAEDREAWRRQLSPEYAAATAEVDAVRPLLAPGFSLYVLGTPLYYPALGRDQALEVNGFSPQQLVPRQWAELTREFLRTRPSVVRVDARAEGPLAVGSPTIEAALRTDYRVLRTSPDEPLRRGTWYALIGPPGTPAPHADGAQL